MAIATLELGGPVSSAATIADARLARRGQLTIGQILRIGLLLLIVGNLGRVPVLDGGKKEAPILLNDVTVVALVAVTAAGAARRRRLDLDRPAVAALAFAAVGALSAMLAIPRFGLNGFQFFFSIAYLIRWLVYFGIYLAVTNFIKKDEVEGIWGVLERAILIFAVFGIFQSIFLPGFAQIVQPEAGWDRQGHRLVSSFLDPNFAGGLIMIGLLMLFARIAYGVHVARWKMVVLFSALLMTLSRSSILAALVAGLVLLAVRGLSRRVVWTTAGLLAFLLPFTPLLLVFAETFDRFSVGGSAAQRFIAWLQAFEVIADHPIIGIGFNTYGYVQEFYNHADAFGGFHYFTLDGGLLFIAVMTGLVGVSIYSLMLLLITRRCLRIAHDRGRSPEDRGTALGIFLVTVAIVVHSVFVNSLLFTLLMHPLWVLWGLSRLLEAPERQKYGASGGSRVPTLAAVGG